MRVVQRAAGAVLLIVLMVSMGLPVQAEPWPECGGFDTTDTASQALTAGAYCTGRVNDCDDQTDYFTFSLNADQRAVARVPVSNRLWNYVQEPGQAPRVVVGDDVAVTAPASPGPHVYRIYVVFDHPSRFDEDIGRLHWACDDGEWVIPYGVRYDIVTNVPPAVGIAAPANVVYKDPYTVVRSASDADGNGDCVWLQLVGGNVQRCDFGSTWSRTDTYTMLQATTFEIRADDIFDETAASAMTVRPVQDDCGTGGDISLQLTPPIDCRGTLQDPVGDVQDDFTFGIPPNVGRIRFSAVLESNWGTSGSAEFRITSANGLSWSGPLAGSTLVVAPGDQVTVSVRSLTGDGSYQVSIDMLPPARPPTLQVTWPQQTTIHQGEQVHIQATASDPNGYDLALEVDWGDGTVSRSPTTDLRPSPHAASFSHRMSYVPQAQVVVKATSADDMTTVDTRTFTVEPEHDCGVGQPGTDAPRRGRSGQALLVPSFICEGHLGYAVEAGALDIGDAYAIRGDGRGYVLHATGDDLTLRTTVWLFGQVPLRGTVGTSSYVEVPFMPVGTHLVEVERLAGKGAYVMALS